jgi:hypothetical protein
MLTFLNSVIFTLAFAALIPLLIHLFNRQKRIKKSFSSVRFLKTLEKQKLNRINIYQYLLIIIRTLIIGSLIFVFARPVLVSDSDFGAAGARTTAVIILDNGISMQYFGQGGMRFDRAIAQVPHILDLFNYSDQVFILPTQQMTAIPADSFEINSLGIGYLPNQWQDIFNNTFKLFEEYPNYNQELYILTDNIDFPQQHLQSRISNNTRAYIIQLGDQTFNNISIDTLAFINELFEPSQNISLAISLTNHWYNKVEDIETHLYINGRRESYNQTSIDPNTLQNIQIAFKPEEYGLIEGFLEISDDALDADNRYYFNLSIPEKINILYVEKSPSLFMRSVLKTIGENLNLEIQYALYEQFALYNLENYDKIFLANVSTLESPIVNRLQEYVQNGGKMILMPGDNSTPTFINRLLKQLDSKLRVLDFISVQGGDSYFGLNNESLMSHTLTRDLFINVDTKLNTPVFYKYFKIDRGENVLIELSNGDPLIVLEKVQNGYILFLTSYIEEEWTNLQFKGLFVPLFTRLLSSDSFGVNSKLNRIHVGDELLYPLSPGKYVSEHLLKTPDNLSITLFPQEAENGQVLPISYFSKPGNYKIYSDKTLSAIVSANIPARKNTFVRTDITIDSNNSENIISLFENEISKEVVLAQRSGVELWKIFVLLAILFIISEVIFIKKLEK